MTTLTIFIHGIGSSSDTWTKFVEVIQSDNDISSIQKYIPNSTNLNDDATYYLLYDYKTEILGKGKFFNNLKESYSGTKVKGNIAIESHVNTLKSFITLNSKKFSKVNIVAHSLGGVVTMKLLLTKDTEIKRKIGKVLLYGVPLKGSDDPNELKKYLGNNIPTKVLQELSPSSITITSLHQKIDQECGYLKENFEILYIKGDRDTRIVEIDEAYAKKFGKLENIQGGHSEIINPNNITDPSFIYFKTFICEDTNEIPQEKETEIQLPEDVISAKSIKPEENINPSKKPEVDNISFTPFFLDFLQSVAILVSAHPNKEKVKLDDIYIYPSVERYSDLKASKKNIDSKELIDTKNPFRLLIAGESQSGKTSLSKKFIVELRKKGLIPIYLSDETNPYEGRIENRIINAFEAQYAGGSIDDIPTEIIVPILDNFHLAKKKERHLSDLTKYPNTILIVDDLFSLNLSKENLLSEYKHYRIKEYSPSLRNAIIKKWMELSDDDISSNDKYELLDNKYELVETSLGKVIGNGIMPAYPFFILTIISTFETFEKPIDQEITSQGYCYQALIYLYLKKQNVKNDDIDTYINFLTEFAFFFYKEKKKEISKDEFTGFLNKYLEEFNLPIKKEVLLNKLAKIQIISLDSFNNYSFSYPYLYYFFVAKYLAEHSDKKTEILVDELIENLHKNENAYILSFISHHSKDDFFLDKLEASANNLFSSHSPATLCTKELDFFDEKANELLKAVLPNGSSSPEIERESKLKAQDEIEENNISNQEVNDEIENNADYLKLRKSIKTLEVMGHIIKNRAGSLKRDKLESIFVNAMNINLRIISDFIELIEEEENQNEILDFFRNRLNSFFKENDQNEPPKEEIDKMVVKLFWNTNFYLISTLINKIVHSLGSDKLIDIVNSVCNKKDTPASFLVKHGILMWYKKNIQINNIIDRVEKDDFSSTSKIILDYMIVNHCSLHDIKTKDLQKIENKLHIKTGKLNTPFKLVKN